MTDNVTRLKLPPELRELNALLKKANRDHPDEKTRTELAKAFDKYPELCLMACDLSQHTIKRMTDSMGTYLVSASLQTKCGGTMAKCQRSSEADQI